jgi:hypothetical protein
VRKAVLTGILAALLAAFPAAACVALVYGFPIPLGGKLRGPEAILPSQLAVLFYGLFFGGFPLVALAGAGAGALGYRLGMPDTTKVRRWVIGLSSLSSLVVAILLAILDLIIGPW